MNGDRPAGEMVTRVRGVKAESEDADANVCVLLLPGAMGKTDAGTGGAALTGAARAGALDDGEVCAVKERSAETWRPGAEAHLTVASAASEAKSAASRVRPLRGRVVQLSPGYGEARLE